MKLEPNGKSAMVTSEEEATVQRDTQRDTQRNPQPPKLHRSSSGRCAHGQASHSYDHRQVAVPYSKALASNT